jgi:glucose-1-phosphate thymidylyltransferase
MIYYPLSVLMLACIRDILLIATPQDLPRFEDLLGDGRQFGLSISYAEQPWPGGIAQAFTLGAEFIGRDSVCLILGDNIFYGQGFVEKLSLAASVPSGASVFAYKVRDPQRFGIIEFDANMRAVSLAEKPQFPRSHWAITGLYFYDNDVVDIAAKLAPSARGELEITDVNKEYLARDRLNVQLLGRGFAWLDTGTHESLLDAGQFVQTIQRRQGMKIACLEEIALGNGWLTMEAVATAAAALERSEYGEYLKELVATHGG